MFSFSQWLKNLLAGRVVLTSDKNVDNAIRGKEGYNMALNDGDPTSSFSGSSGLSSLIQSLVSRLTGAHLTGAQQEANEFSAAEAQKSRDFTEYMTRNKYQMESQSMEQAGLNPAMMYGGGNLVSTAANGSQAQSVSPGEGLDPFGIIMSMMRMPKELDKLAAEAQRDRDQGQAALIAARAQDRQAGASERQAAVAEMRVEIDRALADSHIEVNDETINQLAASASYLRELKDYVSKNYEVAVKNADSEQKKAIAALKQADAAFQNALTNQYLSNYQASLFYAQEMITWTNNEGQGIINRYLDDRQKEELENIRKMGLKLDKEGNLIDKEGHLVTAQTIKTYVNCGTDVANSVSRFVGIGALSNMKSGASSSGAPFADFYGGTSYEPMFP